MKKKFFSILMLSFAAVLMGLSFVSCGDDNDEPDPTPEPSAHPAKIAVGYSLELGDGWWDFFDIEVTYTKATGGSETKTIQKGWIYVDKADYKDAATEYTFTAKATPKATLPEINPDAQYNFDKNAKSVVFGLNAKEEQTEILASKSNATTMSIAGSNLNKWLAEHTNLGAGTLSVKK